MAQMTKCPVCGAKHTENSKSDIKWQIKNFRSHIRKIAEREIFLKSLLNDKRATPHFDYYKKNMVIVESKSLTIKL